MNKLLVWVFIGVVVVAGVFLSLKIFGNQEKNYDVISSDSSIDAGSQIEISDDNDILNPTETETTITPKSYSIEITSSGFSPDTLTINSGDNVIWTNKDTYSSSHWPASANHPTHSVYPEEGGCIGSNFDACNGLNYGENYSFTFNEKGTWKYHDHLNPSETGTITVN